MKRAVCLLGALGALLSLAVAGCSSTGVGNPGSENGTLELGIVADDGSGDAEALPRAALEQASLVLARIEWQPCDASQPPVVQAGPFIVDLLTGSTTPEIPQIDAPEGGLCGFDAPLGPARDSAELAGRSLFFSGTRDDGVRFLLFADMRATLRVQSGDGQSWAIPEQRRPIVWQMRPRRWAQRADLNDAATSTWAGDRRIIRIDVNRHPLLFALIRARLGSESLLLDEQSGADLGSVSSDED
jgi:hypothetical protein